MRWSGAYANWNLKDIQIGAGGTIGNPGGHFQLAKLSHINADGKSDLVSMIYCRKAQPLERQQDIHEPLAFSIASFRH